MKIREFLDALKSASYDGNHLTVVRPELYQVWDAMIGEVDDLDDEYPGLVGHLNIEGVFRNGIQASAEAHQVVAQQRAQAEKASGAEPREHEEVRKVRYRRNAEGSTRLTPAQATALRAIKSRPRSDDDKEVQRVMQTLRIRGLVRPYGSAESRYWTISDAGETALAKRDAETARKVGSP